MAGFGISAPACELLARLLKAGADGRTMDGGLGGFFVMVRSCGLALLVGAGAFFPAAAILGEGAALGVTPGGEGADGFLFGAAIAPAAADAGFLGGREVDFFFLVLVVLLLVPAVLFVLLVTLLLFVLLVLPVLFVVFVVPLPRLCAFFFGTAGEGPAVPDGG
jgi:hypothetical protein